MLLSILFFTLLQGRSQSITGRLANHPNEKVYLYGFDDFEAYAIDSTTTNADGEFGLRFAAKDYGMGYILPAGKQLLIVALADEAARITGDAFRLAETAKIIEGAENKAFVAYAARHAQHEKALSAWRFLEQLYTQDSLFAECSGQQQGIANEIARLKAADAGFLNSLPAHSYMRWFLPIRQLVSSVAAVAQYRPEEIPATRAALRAIDYADDRLYKSGLLKEAVENHVWFIENSSGPLDSVYAHLNTSIDLIIDQLKADNEKFNLITQRLFEVLEERSLYTSSEYLAKRLLQGDDCGCVNADFEKRLHKYMKMAKGATAPDITFTDYTYFPEGVSAKRLSELAADYYLVIFAAGWCGHCQEALPQLAALYPELQAKGIEVVMVSLDETPEGFAQFAAPLPFISTTDYQKWDGQAALDYQVFATPTYYMLGKERTILQSFKSIAHLEAWLEWVF